MAKYKAPKISAAVKKKAAALGLTTEGYHGTTHPFEEFRPSEANGWRDGRPDQYAGTHFGKDPAVSQHLLELAKLNKRLGQHGIGEDPRIIQALLPDLAKMKVVPQIDPTKLPSGRSFVRQEDTSAIRDLLLHEFYKNDPEALERAIAQFESANPDDRRTPFSASEQRVILEHLIGPEWNNFHTAKHNANWNDEVPRGTVLDAIGPDEFAELATNGVPRWDRDNPVRPEVQYARDIASKGVAGLQKQGYEGLIYQNTNPAELRGTSSRPRKTTDPESYIVFDPARIRDTKARFDPASILSRNLMSSVAAATAVGVGATAVGGATAQAQDPTAFGEPLPDGLIERGNIDLRRPSIPNPEGGDSTVYSASFNFGGEEVLLPLADEGRILTEEEAIEKYQRTGQHLGKFSTTEAADAYGEQLHDEYQSNKYAMPEETTVKPERSYMQYLSELIAGPERKNAGQFFVDFDDDPKSDDAPPSPAASSPSRLHFLGNVPNETDRLRGEYQLNRSAAEAHSPLMKTGNSYLDLLTNPASSPYVQAFSPSPAEMETYRRDKYLNKKSSAEHSELMKSAAPAFEELSNLFLSKYDDENGTYRQTLEDNYDDITGNLLGNEYNSGNKAANAWVSNFFDAMNSEKPRGQNAETPYRDPSEVGSNLSDYGDARFAFDKAGLLKKQKLLNQKLEILKTFQEGANAPAFKGFAGKLLANVGGLVSSDTDKLADLRSANRPEDAVGEALYWINEGKDLATSPTYRTGGLTGSSPTAEDSWTTLPGVTTQSTDTPTFSGATANAMMARLYHLKKFAQDPFGANLDFAKGTKALNQQAPVVPAHLREQAEGSKKRLIDLEQTSHYDPSVEFAATLKAMGIKPFYLSGAVNDAVGTIRDLPDAITAGTALFSGGLGLAAGGLRGGALAGKAVARNFVDDFAQELPLGLAIGHSFQPENKGLLHYLFGQGQGLFDKDGNPVAADSENFDAEYARRNKEHDANYDNVASLGRALGKHEAMQPIPSSVSSWGAAPAQGLPVTNPVLPKKTPNDIEYDKWNAQQAQTTRGKAYFDHLKTLRR